MAKLDDDLEPRDGMEEEVAAMGAITEEDVSGALREAKPSHAAAHSQAVRDVDGVARRRRVV